MIHSVSDPIRFAKRFFALREIGVTVAVFMISMCFDVNVCVRLDEIMYAHSRRDY